MNLHANTDFDPEARAIAIVTELEKEALDEDQLHGALQKMVEVFASRQAVAVERVSDEARKRTVERRRDREQAKIKGVTPAQRRSNVIQPASVIPGVSP